jgi:hypothetical protein
MIAQYTFKRSTVGGRKVKVNVCVNSETNANGGKSVQHRRKAERLAKGETGASSPRQTPCVPARRLLVSSFPPQRERLHTPYNQHHRAVFLTNRRCAARRRKSSST